MAVEFEIMQHARMTLAKSPPGTTVGLVVDTALETSGRPVDELDGTLGLDGGHRRVDVLGHNITTVHQAARHVLTVTGVTLDHHGGGLEDGVGDLGDGQLLVVRLLGGDDRRVRGHAEVDTRVRDQVGLELGDVNVQGTVETQRRGERRDALRDQAVEVGVGRALDVQGAAADVVQGLVVVWFVTSVCLTKARTAPAKKQAVFAARKRNVFICSRSVNAMATYRVVGLDNGGGHLGRGVHGEAELGLLAVVDGQALQQQGTQTGTGTTTDGVEDQEALQTSAVVSQLADAVQAQVDDLLTNGVVTTGVVVGGIFLTGDQLLGVEQLTVCTCGIQTQSS